MSTTRILASLLVIGAAMPHASAKPKPSDEAGDDSSERDAGDDDARPARKAKPRPRSGDDDDRSARPAKARAEANADGGGDGGDGLQKQDLNGHDLGTAKKENVFERDRFFVDKTDSDKTARGTLIQGSLTSTTFGYHESGGTITPPAGAVNPTAVGPVPSASQFNRLFAELRLQTDFRHIAASRWEGRVDVRGRMVADPGTSTGAGYVPPTATTSQSGFLGKNEFELKELWLVRNGVRSDLFFGRQFVPDLGGVKIDGLRVDYASSSKFTLLGFGGLYPIRGSRSITSDYTPLQSNPANDGTRSSAGRFTGAGGFGAAYRTLNAYGSFGGVALVPLSSESPRVFGTSTGYWRYGTKLDFYHFAVLDLLGSNAVNTGLTNLSAGVNYKPDQRLRGTLSFNRVDTETLSVQAQAFLADPDTNVNVVQNEAYLQRIATNEGRASLSAGLGELQRFEVTAALAYRYRGEVTLLAPPQMGGMMRAATTLPAAQSVEVYGAITDRRSFKDLRLGLDGARIFGVGSATYQRTASMSLRASAARELGNGHGEWEAEVAYNSTKDDSAGKTCAPNDLATCFGAAQSSILSLGGNLYYRFNRDWLAIGSLFLNRTAVTHVDTASSTEDPAVIGVTGFARVAYRF